jgi:hypothetical protein
MCPATASLQVLGSPQQPCKLLLVLVISACHGRGREFESRRPRHLLYHLHAVLTVVGEHPVNNSVR